MNIKTGLASGLLLLLLGAAPSFAQGVTQTPPAPNSGNSMPEPPNSLPLGARTLAAGSTEMEQMGTIGTARVQQGASVASRY